VALEFDTLDHPLRLSIIRFSCEAGGNILDFVAAMEEVDIRPAALLLVDWFKLQRTAVTK
jgi:hypothetical protein